MASGLFFNCRQKICVGDSGGAALSARDDSPVHLQRRERIAQVSHS